MLGVRPDILHLHEWQCAAVSMLYWDVYYNTGFNTARVVLTIHNMDNSGECRQDEFAVTGVPGMLPAFCSLQVDTAWLPSPSARHETLLRLQFPQTPVQGFARSIRGGTPVHACRGNVCGHQQSSR